MSSTSWLVMGARKEVAEANIAVGDFHKHAVLGLVLGAAADAVPHLALGGHVGVLAGPHLGRDDGAADGLLPIAIVGAD
eukprot:4935596-Alexandrium_andersonii.AAC.1